MRELQLYIDGTRIELFKDETITITDSLKNVKSIDKVFTEYSKTFNIPANSITNKLFKHFYNYNILNGFDARVRVPANIELNYTPFKKGYVKLNGVDLNNGKPDRYRITFYGETISLKNVIGDDELGDLDWLNHFNTKSQVDTKIFYDPDDIEEFLTTPVNFIISGETFIKPLQVPLLSHTQRLYFNSDEDISTPEQDGNLFYDETAATIHGVKFNQLKYGIKLNMIIRAIEERYPDITFSDDFFKDVNNQTFDNLYMWLHRNKGEVTVGGQISNITAQQMIFPDSTASTEAQMIDSNFNVLRSLGQMYIRFNKNIVDIGKSFSFNLLLDGNVILSVTPGIGIQNLEIDVNALLVPIFGMPQGSYTIEVISTDNIIFDSVEIEINFVIPAVTQVIVESGPITKLGGFELNITRQIPKMKILDFLTGIFKMYNLVAYVEDDIIVVKPLDEYYSGGTSFDITEYVDNSKISSDIALPFKEVKYTYKGLKTLLVENHYELENKHWGELEYIGGGDEKFNGPIFDYQLPFEHMKFERLLNLDDNSNTTIQWGWCADGKSEPTIGLPIIFYMALKEASISYINDLNPEKIPINYKGIGTYFAPCNSNMGVSGLTNQSSINFNAELDEWSNKVNVNTLFQDYHSEYMGDIFKVVNRLIKIRAKLPLKVLLKYTLADRFIYIDQPYKINSIKTNFNTGMSEIELINDFSGLLNA